ncbi:MAG: hypothetical protein E6J81_09745 [Deltaproteobacteria bacterium]|nr:MAG: hypothetical protein E6J81_09745 [Deltaproteobacteria bacterium]
MTKNVLLVVLMLLPPGPSTARAGAGAQCRAMCQQTYFDTLLAQCPICSRDVVNARTACLGGLSGAFQACTGACLPFPGRCTLTHECVDACRTARLVQRARCERRFNHQLRVACDVSLPCLVAASQARRDCRKSCRGGTPLTTTTTTTVLPAALVRGCPQDTQRQCVFQVAARCYGQCDDRCQGDSIALKICRRGCRDAVCGLLRGACTFNDRAQSAPYRQLCDACGDCAAELDQAVACEVTTTSTSVSTSSTNTTSTSTSTTSTTLM